MARSLNPQIFGQSDAPIPSVDPGHGVNQRKIRDVEAQVEILNQKIEKWVQILDGKISQLHGHQKNLSEQMKSVSENFSAQQAALQSRLNERRTAESKTQELFDRHNQLVHNFESRISQMQKVSTEQEMKLMSYQATYDEILREIRNIKNR